MESFPKLIALDLDNTLWKGHLNKDEFQKRADPNSVIEDNLVCTDGWTVHDVKGKCSITFATDAPSIINSIRYRDAKIAVVSRNTSKALCDRAMWMLKVTVTDKKESVPLTDLIQYDEVRDEVKENPFHRIQSWSEFEYHEMLFFDDEHRNATVETNLGITFQHVSYKTGITNDIFNAGLKVWRRNQALRVPLPRSPSQNQECLLVGYLGTDLKTATLYEEGKRRPKSDRPSRWGWGMYLTDKPKIASFFAHWRREKQKEGDERICCIYARNGPKFLHELQKVWIKEDGKYMTNNLDANVQDLDKYIMERESHRDEHVKSAYNIEKPYVLFSTHHHMDGMEKFDLPKNHLFNELVIYPQIQDALFIGEAYKPNEVRIGDWPDLKYDEKLTSWNIKSHK